MPPTRARDGWCCVRFSEPAGERCYGKAGRARLFHVATLLFPQTLARQCLLGTPLFSGLQIVAVALDFLDDVFALHFTFEPPESAFEAFPLLNYDFRQINSPPVSCDSRAGLCQAGKTGWRHILSQNRALLCSGITGDKSSNKFLTE